MRRSEKIFTRGERKAALWALVIAIIVTTAGIAIEQAWRRPSLGPDGAASFVFAPTPGVLDARPIG
jgi:hypothetical protein